MEEEWKRIPDKELKGYYDASTLGRIRSVERVIKYRDGKSCRHKGKILKLAMRKGYLSVLLYRKQRPVHRLVAMTFIENTMNKSEVNHLSGIKTDNRVENLEWATRGENREHAIRTGLIDNKGEKNPAHKLTDAQVIDIRIKATMYKDIELAKMNGVCKLTIWRIRTGKEWKHVAAMGEKILQKNKKTD